MRTFFDFDSKLRSTGHYFKRFSSLSALPFNAFAFKSFVSDEQIKHYESMIRRQLISKFAVPQLTRSDFGQLVNVDEALEGITECYRHTRPIKSTLKLGLNISAAYNSNDELFAIRCAAILAVFKLAKQRGQNVQFDVCYGFYGREKHSSETYSHFRIAIPTPTETIIKTVMTEGFWRAMIHETEKVSKAAMYRLWKLDELGLGQEFDFVLDRIETNDPKVEYQRVLKQIERLR